MRAHRRSRRQRLPRAAIHRRRRGDDSGEWRRSPSEAALAREGFVVAREDAAELPSGPDFIRFVSADGAVTLEIQLAKTAFQREVLRRAAPATDIIPVATAEDLLILKLIANRPKDRVDLAGLVRLPALDWDHVERWAKEWGLLAELRRLRAGTARES